MATELALAAGQISEIPQVVVHVWIRKKNIVELPRHQAKTHSGGWQKTGDEAQSSDGRCFVLQQHYGGWLCWRLMANLRWVETCWNMLKPFTAVGVPESPESLHFSPWMWVFMAQALDRALQWRGALALLAETWSWRFVVAIVATNGV